MSISKRNHRFLRTFCSALLLAGVVGLLAAAREGRRTPPAPTARDVPYGPEPRQKLDFWMADKQAGASSPLLVFIHGGGFVTGGKHEIDGRMVDWALKSGISVAAINYRFVTTDPFPAPMHDGARALQFLRSKADAWNIDPDRVAAYGGSAGAGIALWLAFHPDLAEPASDELVARQSSRLKAVGLWAGQTTYNPRQIRDWLGGRAWEHPSLLKLFGLESTSEIDDPRHSSAFAEASPITHLSSDAPPVFLLYNEPDRPLPTTGRPGLGIHHPAFGRHLKQAMESQGLTCHLVQKPNPRDGNYNRDMFEFLKANLLW